MRQGKYQDLCNNIYESFAEITRAKSLEFKPKSELSTTQIAHSLFVVKHPAGFTYATSLVNQNVLHVSACEEKIGC